MVSELKISKKGKKVVVQEKDEIIYLGYKCEITTRSIRTVSDYDRMILSKATIEAFLDGKFEGVPKIKKKNAEYFILKEDFEYKGISLKKGLEVNYIDSNRITFGDWYAGDQYWNINIRERVGLVGLFQKKERFSHYTFLNHKIRRTKTYVEIGCKQLLFSDLRKILKLINNK